jgi:hypothetical protein
MATRTLTPAEWEHAQHKLVRMFRAARLGSPERDRVTAIQTELQAALELPDDDRQAKLAKIAEVAIKHDLLS